MGGATVLYLYGYSFHYFKPLESNSVTTYILYFGYMELICFGLYLITGGTVGLLSAFWFNKKIFGSIKIDEIDGLMSSVECMHAVWEFRLNTDCKISGL